MAARLAQIARELSQYIGDLRAQTVPYALLIRRWGAAANIAPLLDGFDDADAVGRIEQTLDGHDLAAIRARYEAEGKEPAVYFYEDFARAYDPASARGRGMRYTPPEVVSFIVRGVDSILRERFGVTLHDALVVDPCCGVGTFLRHIEKGDSPRRGQVATEQAAMESRHYGSGTLPFAERPRMIGMELMPAPCAIARCLLGEAQIVHSDWLSDPRLELDGRLLVILGNPPYSGHSSNAGKIADLMADYRVGLSERNPKWLQDDYVKFIRMAQHQVECAGRGVVAFVTNHSYLFNPTFRAMRQSLANAFDEIRVLDLGGNVKRLDRQDENVFPIQMGVAISFFVRASSSETCRIRYARATGERARKLKTLAETSLDGIEWADVPLAKPFAIFVASADSPRDEFYGFRSLFDVFREHTMGFVTSRDSRAIGFSKEEVPARPQEVLYRPFDRRWACCSRATMERPRLPFMENLMRENVALAIGRAGQVTGSSEWDVVFVTDRPADLNLFRRGGAKLFPRYVYRGDQRVSNMAEDDADPDALFCYIYAVLHSTAYRARYAQCLAIDYPRIPMPHDSRVFETLAKSGARLIDTHLMRRNPKRCRATALQSAASITIGGYIEPEKCLRDRAGVDSDEQAELVRSAVAMTLDLRAEIDRVISASPPWQQQPASPRSPKGYTRRKSKVKSQKSKVQRIR